MVIFCRSSRKRQLTSVYLCRRTLLLMAPCPAYYCRECRCCDRLGIKPDIDITWSSPRLPVLGRKVLRPLLLVPRSGITCFQNFRSLMHPMQPIRDIWTIPKSYCYRHRQIIFSRSCYAQHIPYPRPARPPSPGCRDLGLFVILCRKPR